MIEFAFERFDRLNQHHKSIDMRFDLKVMKNKVRRIHEQSKERIELVISFLMPNRVVFPVINYNHQVESICECNHLHNHPGLIDSHPPVILPFL